MVKTVRLKTHKWLRKESIMQTPGHKRWAHFLTQPVKKNWGLNVTERTQKMNYKLIVCVYKLSNNFPRT